MTLHAAFLAGADAVILALEAVGASLIEDDPTVPLDGMPARALRIPSPKSAA